MIDSMDINTSSDSIPLKDGARIAVVGGGPTGSFFSYFALQMADLVDIKLDITVFEPRDFTKDGPAGCNHCGGIVSELLIQLLAIEGINLPETIVRKGINSYTLHTEEGDATIATPHFDKTIATISRGAGPKGLKGDKESFDLFLLKQATSLGAVHESARVTRIDYEGEKPVLHSQNRDLGEYDLVVGAFGVNATAGKMFEGMGFGYKEPPVIKTTIAELQMDAQTVEEYFGSSVHLFLLPDKGLKFAAMIPKGIYVTLCILGSKVDSGTIDFFLNKGVVKKVLPPPEKYDIICRCLPKMNVGAPQTAFADRVVVCGDAGSTRLFKDGIGSAYLMGKAAAKAAVFNGISAADFREDYYPVYRSLRTDNFFGAYLYSITDIYRKNSIMTEGMIKTVRREQSGPPEHRVFSEILYDMFTGNERYMRIFPKALSVRMHIELWSEIARTFGRRIFRQ